MLWYPPILTYHRVHPTLGPDSPTIPPDLFEKQMRILANHWHPIPLAALAVQLEKGVRMDRRAVVVTFDDGTADNFEYAYPLLQRYKIPATIFLIVSNIGKQGSLQSQHILTMAKNGLSFGSHTLHHAYLPAVPENQFEQEISGSKRELERMGVGAELFSYPAGGFTTQAKESVRGAGYRAACTTNRGFQRFPIDRWALRRITMHANTTTRLDMWLRCSGYYGLNRRLRHPA